MSSVPSLPTATYRLQLNRDFGFAEARALVPYLDRLGISHVYVSPIFAARSGSAHGYDMVDPRRLNHELGTDADFAAFVDELHAHGMGLILDIVPNHMAASTENPWWTDVLTWGPASPYAGFFAIDWRGPDPSSGAPQKILVPVLGEPYGQALESGALQLKLDADGLFIDYHGLRFPLNPGTYHLVLDLDGPAAISDEARERIRAIAAASHALTTGKLGDDDHLRRTREGRTIIESLWSLYTSGGTGRAAVEDCLAAAQGTPGDPASFDRLHNLLEAQPYRLAFWKVAAERATYRRFFDISDLVAVRAEDPAVVEATHALIFRFIEEGKAQGLRIDHVDGLRDPAGYLRYLRRRLDRADTPPPYIVVEKILAPGEDLPPDWPVAGTTGYDFLNVLTAVFVDPDGLAELGNSYGRFTGAYDSFDEGARREKRRVIHELFAGETQSLVRRLGAIAAHDRHARDLSPEELRAALVAVTACLPVYRTYAAGDRPAPQDSHYVDAAIAAAEQDEPTVPAVVFSFLRRVLSLAFPPTLSEEQRRAWREFVSQWQQLTGPVTAKGVEDTAFYVYNRLLALNEVGGDPDINGEPVANFHAFNAHRRSAWPHSLNTTSTHDTKRGADVRARLVALSEVPGEWERAVRRWSRWNQPWKTIVEGRPVPDANEEWFLYQTLVGAWPLADADLTDFRERLGTYLRKAMREAKAATSWLRPNVEHEEAVLGFVEAILTPGEENRFLPDFVRFTRRIAAYGAITGLAQVVLHATAPGIPDIYRGTEVWDLTLADPDNRRPIDYELLRQMLQEVGDEGGSALDRRSAHLLAHWSDGRIKLEVLTRALATRRAEPDLFAGGDYLPLEPRGERATHLVAFARRQDDRWAVTIAPRLIATLRPRAAPPVGRRTWGDTCILLPPGAPVVWRDALTGQRLRARQGSAGWTIPIHHALRTLPVSLLVGRASSAG